MASFEFQVEEYPCGRFRGASRSQAETQFMLIQQSRQLLMGNCALRLLRVDGELIRVWELKDDAGGQVLTVDLVKAVTPAP
jgi:hypothetical protein